MTYDDVEQFYFVWNADWSIAGALNAAKEFVQGVESCALCDIAYSGVTQKADWKACKASIPVPIETLYKNKLPEELVGFANDDFPLVLVKTFKATFKMLDNKQIESCEGDVEAFKDLILDTLTKI